jgi:uncharacterized protein DUF1844
MTDESNDQQEKKIFVDEDWKTRVQAEKEAAKQQKKEAEEEEPEAKGEPAPQETAPRQEIPLPPPSLGYLATSLATQAMMSLGLTAQPESEKSEVRLQEAQHLIDTLALLQEKTEGNRTPEESAMFDSFLHELRLAYVKVNQPSES